MAKPVADLRPGELSAEAQKLPINGDIDILRHTLDEIPALAETGAALEGDVRGVWQCKQCAEDSDNPPVLLYDLRVFTGFGLDAAEDVLAVLNAEVDVFHR